MIKSHRRPLWVVGVALSIGASVIHFAFGPEHVAELGPLGYGFYLSGALQLGWAAVLGILLVIPQRRDTMRTFRMLVRAGIAINISILGAWAFSRVVGLPAGEMPWMPEAIGRPDTIAGILEGFLVLGLVGWLRGWTIFPVSSTRWLALGAAIALSAVAVGTVVAITPEAAGHAEAHAQAAGDDHAAADGQVGSGSR